MGERVKVRFTKNYIAPVGAGISGQKDSYKVFPVSDQLTALLNDGTVELVKAGEAERRETATVQPDETSGNNPKKDPKDTEAIKPKGK